MKSCNDWVWANDPSPGGGAAIRRDCTGPITESGRRSIAPGCRDLGARFGKSGVAPSGIAGPAADELRNRLGFTGLARSK
jgi:hypothetical protein